MNQRILTPILIIAWVAAAVPPAAAAPPGLMRSRANAVRAAVKKNIDIIIRPKLVVARRSAGPVSTLALSRDERYLITAVGDHSLRLWDLAAGREVAVLTGHKAPVVDTDITPDGSRAVSIDRSGQVRLFDLKNPEKSRIVPLSPVNARYAGFADNGRRVVIGQASGPILQWDVTQWTALPDVAIGPGRLSALLVLFDRPVALAAMEKGAVLSFDLSSGSRLNAFPADRSTVTALALAADRTLLVGGTDRGKVLSWDFQSGKSRPATNVIGEPITALALSPDAAVVAVGDGKGRVTVWPAGSPPPSEPMGGHAKAVTYLQFDMTGKHLLSASADGTTRLWNHATGKALLTLISTLDGWAVVDAHGRFDGSQDALAGIEWQHSATKLPVDNFSEVYYRPALMARTLVAPETLKPVQVIEEGIHLPPEVELKPDDSTRQDEMIQVRVRGRDQGNSGVETVRLYRNGKKVSEKAEVRSEQRKDSSGVVEMVKDYRLPLIPGKNVLSAVAVNRERLESVPVEVVVDGKPSPAPTRMWLAVVGINRYRNPGLNLDYARKDADSLRAFFAAPGRFPFSEVRMAALNDEKATRTAIVDMLGTLERVEAQDVVVIYLAGHGISDGDHWYFVPHDAEHPDDPGTLKSRGISSDALRQALEAVSANRVFVLIDACQSGSAVSPMKSFGGMRNLRMLARNVGVHILAATDRDQGAVELKQLGHGIFTYALLQGLKGPADAPVPDGIVSVREAMTYVERWVPSLSRRFANYAQFPTAHSRGNDFGLVTLAP